MGIARLTKNQEEEVRLKDDPSAQEWAGLLGLNTSYDLPKKSDSADSKKHDDNQIQTSYIQTN